MKLQSVGVRTFYDAQNNNMVVDYSPLMAVAG